MNQFVDAMTSREEFGALAPCKATGVEARTSFHKSGRLELTLSEDTGGDDFWDDIENDQSVQVLLPKHFFQSKADPDTPTCNASFQNQAEPNPEMSPVFAFSAEPMPEMSPLQRSRSSAEPCPELSPCMTRQGSPIMSPLMPEALPEVDTWPFSDPKQESRFTKQLKKAVESVSLSEEFNEDTWFAWDMLAGMVQQPLTKADPSHTSLAWSMLAGMVQHPLPKADPSDTSFAFDLLTGFIFDWESETLVWDMLAGMAQQPSNDWGETWSTWEMLAGMVQQPLARANPVDTEFAFKMLAGSVKFKVTPHKVDDADPFVWGMLAGSVAHPLAKADPADTWLAFDLLAGSAKIDFNSETLALDMLAGMAEQPEDKWGDSWFAWGMLTGMVQHPLAKANAADSAFAWSLLGGSAIPAPVAPMNLEFRRKLIEAEEATWFVWDLLAGSVVQCPLAEADPADTWFAFDLLAGSAKKACTETYFDEDTFVLDMLAGTASPKEDMWGDSWFAWEMLKGSVKQPLAKASAADTQFAVKMLERFCVHDKSFLTIPTPVVPVVKFSEEEAFVWEMLAGSVIHPQIPLAKADINDMWFAFDLLAGMVQQPLAQADPNDTFAWDLLSGSALNLQSKLAREKQDEVDWIEFEYNMVWDMLSGSVATEPLAKADPTDTWFAFEMLADSVHKPRDEPEISKMWFAFEMLAGSAIQLQSPLAKAMAEEVELEEQYGIAWSMLAGSVPNPLAKADPADMWFAFDMLEGMVKPTHKVIENDVDLDADYAWEKLAGSAVAMKLTSALAKAFAEEVDLEEYGDEIELQSPLAKAVAKEIELEEQQPPQAADSADMWFVWSLLAGSAIEHRSKLNSIAEEVEDEDELDSENFVWDMLKGFVQQPLAKADPADAWFAWSLLAGSSKEFDWESQTLTWDLLAGSVQQPITKADPDSTLAWDMLAGSVKQPLAKADPSVTWFAWDMLAGSAIPVKSRKIDWSSETLAWELLADSVQQPLAEADPCDSFAWDMLAGMVKQPLAAADSNDTWFAWGLLAQSGSEEKWDSDTFAWTMLAQSVQHPLDHPDPADMWFAWGLLAGSEEQIDFESESLALDLLKSMVQRPLAEPSDSDLSLAFDLLAGMMAQPLAKADPTDMWFAWDLLAGSQKERDYESKTLAWDMLAGSVQQPLAKADPNDTLAWGMLAGMVKHPLAQADPADTEFAFNMLAGSSVSSTPWNPETFVWDMLAGSVQQPLSNADTDDTAFAFEMLAGSAQQPLDYADPIDTCLAWTLLTGMVKQPLAMSDPNDMWFAWELLAGSARDFRQFIFGEYFDEVESVGTGCADDVKFAPPPRKVGTWDLLEGMAVTEQPSIEQVKLIK
jgi:hypothetical protein